MAVKKAIKTIALGMMVCSWLACHNDSSITKTVDSTKAVVDTQKYVTRDSVIHKSDSNKHLIDSGFQVLKDSMQKVKQK